jgi:hypothetical protein
MPTEPWRLPDSIRCCPSRSIPCRRPDRRLGALWRWPGRSGHQERHQPAPRVGVCVQPEHRPYREHLVQQPERRSQTASGAQPVRRMAGRKNHPRPPVLLLQLRAAAGSIILVYSGLPTVIQAAWNTNYWQNSLAMAAAPFHCGVKIDSQRNPSLFSPPSVIGLFGPVSWTNRNSRHPPPAGPEERRLGAGLRCPVKGTACSSGPRHSCVQQCELHPAEPGTVFFDDLRRVHEHDAATRDAILLCGMSF